MPPTGILLALAGGRMEYLRLLKLLYISDREMIAVSLSPITGDRVAEGQTFRAAGRYRASGSRFPEVGASI